MPFTKRKLNGAWLIALVLGVAIVGLGAREHRAAATSATNGDGKIALDDLWLDLQKDELAASRTLLKLNDRPKETVAFLEKKLKPLKIDEEQVKALIEWLGSDKEEIWKPAFEQLEYFDPRLAIDLETLMATVKTDPSRHRMVEVMSEREANQLEGKTIVLWAIRNGDGFNFRATPGGAFWAEHKIDRINEGWGNKKKKWTRAVRAIVLLEHIRTPEAIAVLKDMTTGHPDAQPTKTAKDALKRIAAETQSQSR